MAIGELAQALLDSQVLENALAAAFGAREKAQEAQQAALAALNLPSASDVERPRKAPALPLSADRRPSRTRSTGFLARSASSGAKTNPRL